MSKALTACIKVVAEDMALEKEEWTTPRGINNGGCRVLAVRALKLFHDDSAILMDGYKYQKMFDVSRHDKEGRVLSSHWWIYYDERHFDVEEPEGVESPFELPFFNRYKEGGSK